MKRDYPPLYGRVSLPDTPPLFPPDLDWLPRPPALERNPELAVLAVLHVALEATVFALVGAHPHLATLDPPPDPDTLVAHRLMVAVWEFQAHLTRYGRAVVAAVDPDAQDREGNDDEF